MCPIRNWHQKKNRFFCRLNRQDFDVNKGTKPQKYYVMTPFFPTFFTTYTYHSSEKRGLRSTFLSSEMLQNAICIEKENPPSVFRFLFWAVLSFTLWMPGLVYVDIDRGIHKVQNLCKNPSLIFFHSDPLRSMLEKRVSFLSMSVRPNQMMVRDR